MEGEALTTAEVLAYATPVVAGALIVILRWISPRTKTKVDDFVLKLLLAFFPGKRQPPAKKPDEPST